MSRNLSLLPFLYPEKYPNSLNEGLLDMFFGKGKEPNWDAMPTEQLKTEIMKRVTPLILNFEKQMSALGFTEKDYATFSNALNSFFAAGRALGDKVQDFEKRAGVLNMKDIGIAQKYNIGEAILRIAIMISLEDFNPNTAGIEVSPEQISQLILNQLSVQMDATKLNQMKTLVNNLITSMVGTLSQINFKGIDTHQALQAAWQRAQNFDNKEKSLAYRFAIILGPSGQPIEKRSQEDRFAINRILSDFAHEKGLGFSNFSLNDNPQDPRAKKILYAAHRKALDLYQSKTPQELQQKLNQIKNMS
jgi:hypothetical protein